MPSERRTWGTYNYAALWIAMSMNIPTYLLDDFSNLWPRKISFRTGGLLTCLIGVLMQPWKLLASYGNYVSGWLVGYSGFLGPVAGILICGYFVRRKEILNAEDLYRRGGMYEFSRGIDWKAILALVAGCAVAFVGLSRGRTIIENGNFFGEAGSGEFIRRQTYSAI